mmetsp:Transcript_14445/g.48367  ORF Transcript_14445/g.48367 Transcript_14445/m.48367 type:complete len:217 (+) Transcript_14445:255-905(+)
MPAEYGSSTATNEAARLPASRAHCKEGGVGAQTAQHVPPKARRSPKTVALDTVCHASSAAGSTKRGVKKPISRAVRAATRPELPRRAADSGAQSGAFQTDDFPATSPSGTEAWSTVTISKGDAVSRSTAPLPLAVADARQASAENELTTPSSAAASKAPPTATHLAMDASAACLKAGGVVPTASSTKGGRQSDDSVAIVEARLSPRWSLRQSLAKT